ncbi:hypothetical protein M3P21_15665 [Ruegeria sp. 2012CJ41-6]|uniref:Uncharacterized protein n=1 Tax=Ruegeria spongiae TaxID=2942209 RepID=A0ABT0Q522_9RHOB|nr:hypothetical protein [Ruegeria spongiae]MCL6284969.1 hypothetical protein [Ruegeria spongiae]
MATQAIDGAALRQMVNLARKQSISFAFCPGSKNDDVLLLDKRQPAAGLAKDAKKIGSSPKTAFGRMRADAKTIQLECESALPNLAKSIRKYLKDNGVSTEVQLVDGIAPASEPEEDSPATQEASAAREPKPEVDKAAQRALSTQLKDALMTAARAGPVAQRLAAAAAKQIAAQIKRNELEAATESLSELAGRIRDTRATPAEQPAPEQAAPDLASARRDWAQARKSAAGDVRALVAGVAKATGDSEGLSHAQREIAKLVQPIRQLDTRLETLLAQIEKAGSAAERQKLTKAAQRQIGSHVGLMNTAFFKAVDQSGFADTNIRATVLGSLRKVNKVIGA